MADAEDIVQDTLLKWLTIDTSKIHNTKAYLIKSVKNNCINHIERLKKTGGSYLHSINADEIIDWYKEKEFFKFDMENEVSSALAILHKRLEPIEKGIFVLREFFDFDYEELQHIFDKKKENCRKLFSRAKQKLAADTTGPTHLDEDFKSNFKKAADQGQVSAFIDHIKKEHQSSQKK